MLIKCLKKFIWEDYGVYVVFKDHNFFMHKIKLQVDGNVKCHNCPGNPAMIKMEVKPRSLAPYFLNEFITCLGLLRFKVM